MATKDTGKNLLGAQQVAVAEFRGLANEYRDYERRLALLKQKESLSEEELLERVRLQKLMLHLEVRLESLAQNLGTNWQRVRDQTQPAKEYADVLAHAVETFGSRTNANAWLNKPNRLFHNQTPLQILTEDPAAVEEELVRIDHGMFI